MKHLCLTYLIFFFLIASQSAPARTINLTLTWDRNPERNITRYSVYYRQTPSVYFRRLETVTGTTATVAVPDNSVVYFKVTAINSAGLESPFSKRVRWP